MEGRPPHGGRGLKFRAEPEVHRRERRPPHGGRGLKYFVFDREIMTNARRPPHGGRGLKWCLTLARLWAVLSSPARGTWIEMTGFCPLPVARLVVPRTGDVD